MRRISAWLLLGVLPAALLTMLSLGCSGGNSSGTKKEPVSGGNGEVDSGDRKPVASKGRGSLKGKVVLTSHSKPDFGPENQKFQSEINKDKEQCLDQAPPDQKEQQNWRIGDKGEVQYAVISVRAPENQYFKMEKDVDLKPEAAGWKEVITIDQPHCAFEPHVVVAFPSYVEGDSGKQKKTGQTVKVVNSASITHNTKFAGGNPMMTPKDMKGTEIPIKADDKHPENISCSIHPWMSGYIWAFDNPYAAVTGKDGTFEIKNVPAGVKLTVVGWHEKANEFFKKEVEVQDGKPTDLGELTVPAPK